MTLRLIAAAMLLLLPAAALGHGGDHGGPRSIGEVSLVSIQGYQVELLSEPSPLAPGQESQVVVKVIGDSAREPVSGGRVLISIVPAGAPPDFQSAPEVTWAGSYAVPFTPAKRGVHQVRVALTDLDGRRFDPPLQAEFHVGVGRSPGMGAAAWTLVVLLGGVAFLGLYLVAYKAKVGRPEEPLNLLGIPWLRRLLTWPALQPSLQIPLLLLMGIVVFLGLFDVQDAGVNVATKLTWTIWWAGVIFTFVLAGRVWCLACPFGALNEWTARASGASRRLPRIFRNVWWATGLFVLLTWADEQLGVSLEDSLQEVGQRMQCRDLEQVAMVAALQRETGGNSADVLDQVAENIRERAGLRRLVRTLTAQGRMARWIVSALPVFLLFVILMLNRGYMEPLFSRTSGRLLLGLAALMIVSGSLVIRRIVDIKV